VEGAFKMKKCFLTILTIYLAYIWLPPFITVLFPISEKQIKGNYIAKDCTIEECSFYNLHFNKNNELIMQCIDSNGTIYKTDKVTWSMKNGHSIEIEGDYDRFYFPHFGDIHRNLFFPWIFKIETAIDGQCELDEWYFATKI
jgi:hypothetical protein